MGLKNKDYVKIKCEKCSREYSFPKEVQTLWCCGHHTPSVEKNVELAKKKNEEYQKYLKEKENKDGIKK